MPSQNSPNPQIISKELSLLQILPFAKFRAISLCPSSNSIHFSGLAALISRSVQAVRCLFHHNPTSIIAAWNDLFSMRSNGSRFIIR
jgi:hypothetical protein